MNLSIFSSFAPHHTAKLPADVLVFPHASILTPLPDSFYFPSRPACYLLLTHTFNLFTGARFERIDGGVRLPRFSNHPQPSSSCTSYCSSTGGMKGRKIGSEPLTHATIPHRHSLTAGASDFDCAHCFSQLLASCITLFHLFSPFEYRIH